MKSLKNMHIAKYRLYFLKVVIAHPVEIIVTVLLAAKEQLP